MNNKQLEARIKQAFSNAAPDDFAALLADCKNRKGDVIILTERKTSNRWIKRAAGLAAALVLAVGGVFGFSAYRANFAVDSTVSLDVNPSIEIQLNQRDRVLDVLPLNEDGNIVLGDMDLKGSSLDVSVNALIGSMLRNGYLNDITNSILVSVDNNNPEKSVTMQKRLADEINTLLQTDTFSGAVLSQTIRRDSGTQELAEQYGITPGKVQLIQQIIGQNQRYSFADLASLSINELNLISESGGGSLENIESLGTASDKGYVGEDRAREKALGDSAVSASDIRDYECEMDYEQGKMIYEIEFVCNGEEYQYEIDAVTGEVIRSGKAMHDDPFDDDRDDDLDDDDDDDLDDDRDDDLDDDRDDDLDDDPDDDRDNDRDDGLDADRNADRNDNLYGDRDDDRNDDLYDDRDDDRDDDWDDDWDDDRDDDWADDDDDDRDDDRHDDDDDD